MRKGVCYDTFEDGQCLDPREMRVTKAQCCCSNGSGWGFRKRGITCEVCPESYEGESFIALCSRSDVLVQSVITFYRKVML